MSSDQTGLKANMKVGENSQQIPQGVYQQEGQETGEVLDFHSCSASFPYV